MCRNREVLIASRADDVAYVVDSCGLSLSFPVIRAERMLDRHTYIQIHIHTKSRCFQRPCDARQSDPEVSRDKRTAVLRLHEINTRDHMSLLV